jgi:4-amino-4-deoxy-L-arabinose transferase-like glycosyltransferase
MSLARRLWDQPSSGRLLLGMTALAMFVKLGAAELWTLEGRWAAICDHMLRSGDYLHPYLFGQAYYDKPLLSYWLMIASARLLGQLDETALRLPSALAGVASVWLLYRLGSLRFGRSTGLVAGFVLATSYMFVFWSRVASADVLNVAGTIAAVTWYFARRDDLGFVTLAVFFVVVALTCLTKGLIGAAIPFLVILPDIAAEGHWKGLLRPGLVPAALLGLVVYLAPFVASSLNPPPGYAESGLGMVFRENAVRYFDAFDHEGPVYLYFIELPVYLLPWSVLLPAVVWAVARGWRTDAEPRRRLAIGCLLVFLFLTASGSRRSYYVLPLVPFVALLVADWLQTARPKADGPAAWGIVGVLCIAFVWFGVVVPAGFRRGGERILAREVRAQAETEAPWNRWRILVCGAPPAAGYYFRTDEEPVVIPAEEAGSVARFIAENPHTVVITKQRFVEEIRAQVPSARMLTETSRLPRFLRSRHGSDRDLVAFIP